MRPDAQFTEAVRLTGDGNLGEAETLCRNALRSDAHDVSMLALLGAILLKGGRIEEAQTVLTDAVEMAPTFAKPHEDLGFLYMHKKDYSAAAGFFRKAADIDATQASVFFGLSHALHELGRNTEAEDAHKKFLTLSVDSNPLAEIVSLRNTGDLDKARTACGRLLAREPGNHQAMRQLAMIAAEEGQAPEAERLLLRVVELAPDSIVAVMDLANFYRDQQRFPEAISGFQRAIDFAPDDSDARLGLAHSLFTIGEAQAALAAFSACLEFDDSQEAAMLGCGNALRMLGRSGEAVDVYRRCLSREGIYASACWNLASMRSYEFDDQALADMHARRREPNIDDQAAVSLDFSIAKALDDRAEYDDAWKHYVAGNHRQRAAVQFDGVGFETGIDSLVGTYSQNFCSREKAQRAMDATPIFIVGMPRAGSTLLEQILASHSQVEGTTELPYLQRMALLAHTSPANGISAPIVTSDDDRLRALGEEYLRACRRHRPEQKPFFIDKLPDNFQNVGFIHLILPNAIIIDARREPMDTCIANFRQLFGQGKEFSYDPMEIGEMYLQYARMMQHWDDVLPGKVLRVRYEDVVRDTEQQIRRMLKHCGLRWEDGCLEFSTTERTITTASSEQVRLPIFSSSIGFWRNYEAHLSELTEVLQPLIGGQR